MELTISRAVATAQANNIARIVGPHLFNKDQLVGFFTWLDNQIRSSGDIDSEAADLRKKISIKNIVGAVPMSPLRIFPFIPTILAKISARHPHYLSDLKSKDTNELPPEAQEIFDVLFAGNSSPYSQEELICLLDSIITLIGYDLENTEGTAKLSDTEHVKGEILTGQLAKSIQDAVAIRQAPSIQQRRISQ